MKKKKKERNSHETQFEKGTTLFAPHYTTTIIITITKQPIMRMCISLLRKFHHQLLIKHETNHLSPKNDCLSSDETERNLSPLKKKDNGNNKE